MEMIRICCPHCQFSKMLPRDKAPPKPVTATCPQCKKAFFLDPEACPVVDPAKAATTGSGPPAEPAAPHSTPGTRPQPVQPPRQPPPHSHPRQQALLRNVGTLLGDAWQLFQRRFGTLFTVYLLCLLLAVVPPALCGGLGFALAAAFPSVKGLIILLAATLGIVAATIGFSWGWGACVAASLDEQLDLKASYARSREKLWSFALVTFLVGFVIAGGFFLFILPGIVFMVWFFFAQFVIFDDDTPGMAALLKSKAYVSGHGLNVFLRLVVIWTCTALLGAMPIVGPILSLLAAPYAMLYQALLFQDLKKVSGPVIYSCGFGENLKWVGLALLGYIVVPAALLFTFGAAVYQNIAPFMGKGGIGSLPAQVVQEQIGGTGSADGFRVIPIPQAGSPQTESPAAPVSGGVTEVMPQQETSNHPEHIHIFIYSVNYTGTVTANGASIQELGPKPDMQYNYNMGGDKLVYGKNSIAIDYTPIREAGATMLPRLHMKVSFWKGSTKQVLGDWEIKETVAGQKVFDLEIPESLKTQQ